MDSELGAWLRQQREARGWPKAEMARRLVQAAHEAGDRSVPSASGMLHWPDSGNGPASFHCEIAVDGQVVAQQDATTTVTCAARPG